LFTIAPDSDGFFGQVDCAFELRVDGRPFDHYKTRATAGRPEPFRQTQQQTFRPPQSQDVGRSPRTSPRQQHRQDDSDDDAELKRALAMSAAEERDRQAKLRGTGGAANASRATQRSVELAREAQIAAAVRGGGLPSSAMSAAALRGEGVRSQATVTPSPPDSRQSSKESARRDPEGTLEEQMEQAAILASLAESGRIAASNSKSQIDQVRQDPFQQQSNPPSKNAWGDEVPQKKKKSKEIADPWSSAAQFGSNSGPSLVFGSVSGGFGDQSNKGFTNAWPSTNEASGWPSSPPPPPTRTCSSFSSVEGSSSDGNTNNGYSPADSAGNNGFSSWDAVGESKDVANPWAGCDSPMSVKSAPVLCKTVLAPVVEPEIPNPWGLAPVQTSAPSQAFGSDPWGITRHASAPEVQPPSSSDSGWQMEPSPSPSPNQTVSVSAHFTLPADPWSETAAQPPAPSVSSSVSAPIGQQSGLSPWPPLQPAASSPSPWPPQSAQTSAAPWPPQAQTSAAQWPVTEQSWPPTASATSQLTQQSVQSPWPVAKDVASDNANPFSNSDWPKVSGSSPSPWF